MFLLGAISRPIGHSQHKGQRIAVAYPLILRRVTPPDTYEPGYADFLLAALRSRWEASRVWDQLNNLWGTIWPLAASVVANQSFWAETSKLVVQLAGGLLIARWTVKWALGRFKSEKTWERELGVMVDLVRNLAELRRLATVHRGQVGRPVPLAEDLVEDLLERARQANADRESLAAAVRLMMPRDAGPVVERLDARMKKAGEHLRSGDQLSYWTEQVAALDDAIMGLQRVWARRAG